MENASKLEAVLEWMRLHGVKAYTDREDGFSLELFEDQVSPQLHPDSPANPYEDPDLFHDGKVPRFRRLSDE